MTKLLIDRHTEALGHEERAHLRVLRSLDSVPAERRDEEDYTKAVDLFAHLLRSRTLWLARLRGQRDEQEDWFPTGKTLAELETEAEGVYGSWRSYLGELSDADLDSWFRYTSWEGEAYENRIDDIVIQLRGHSHYHRGQIAQLVRRSGGKPALTDHVPVTRRRPTTP